MRLEKRATEAFEGGLVALQPFVDGPDAADLGPDDKAEVFGVRGGLLRRLSRTDLALASYENGSEIEREAGLSSTYNRINAVKLALISDKVTLAEARPRLLALETAIESTIGSDVQAASDAWTHADLGDVRLLAGHVEKALDAYGKFRDSARSDSPRTTVTVLRELVAALTAHDDPGAEQLASDAARIEELLRLTSSRES
jgi:hypothetical protein